MIAFNRLLLIAPSSVLDAMQTMNGLLSRVEERRREEWTQDWATARGALAAAARDAVGHSAPA